MTLSPSLPTGSWLGEQLSPRFQPMGDRGHGRSDRCSEGAGSVPASGSRSGRNLDSA